MQNRRGEFRKKRMDFVISGLKRMLEDGNSDEIKKDELLAYIDTVMADFDTPAGKERMFDRSVLPTSGIVNQDSKVVLKVVDVSEKEQYMTLFTQTSDYEGNYSEQIREDMWADLFEEKVFVCSIYDANTNHFVGYCSIKDLRAKEWELAIELLEAYRHQGYGTSALSLFMEKITEITGNRFYTALVDIDNAASQNLMKKIGAYPDGIVEHLIHGVELKRFREENRDMIDDNIRKLAEEFICEPEDLLGMVLKFRFDMHETMDCVLSFES